MTWLEIVILLIVAAICGGIGQAIGGYDSGSFLASVALGFIGAIFGIWIARGLHLPELFHVRIGDITFPIIWSIIGAAIFVAFLGMFRRRVYLR